MPRVKKDSQSDTLSTEAKVYAVKLDDENIVSVEANSAAEAVKLAKAEPAEEPSNDE